MSLLLTCVEQVSFLGNPTNIKITAVASGDHHAVILTEVGEVYVWGVNDNGYVCHNNIYCEDTNVLLVSLVMGLIKNPRKRQSSCH